MYVTCVSRICRQSSHTVLVSPSPSCASSVVWMVSSSKTEFLNVSFSLLYVDLPLGFHFGISASQFPPLDV